jgi:hypothetical protein
MDCAMGLLGTWRARLDCHLPSHPPVDVAELERRYRDPRAELRRLLREHGTEPTPEGRLHL